MPDRRKKCRGCGVRFTPRRKDKRGERQVYCTITCRRQVMRREMQDMIRALPHRPKSEEMQHLATPERIAYLASRAAQRLPLFPRRRRP